MSNSNIFVETNVIYLCIQKHKYTPKNIGMFLVFMKVEGMLSHIISHNMNHVWIPYD